MARGENEGDAALVTSPRPDCSNALVIPSPQSATIDWILPTPQAIRRARAAASRRRNCPSDEPCKPIAELTPRASAVAAQPQNAGHHLATRPSSNGREVSQLPFDSHESHAVRDSLQRQARLRPPPPRPWHNPPQSGQLAQNPPRRFPAAEGMASVPIRCVPPRGQPPRITQSAPLAPTAQTTFSTMAARNPRDFGPPNAMLMRPPMPRGPMPERGQQTPRGPLRHLPAHFVTAPTRYDKLQSWRE